jgi:hypothetical protein
MRCDEVKKGIEVAGGIKAKDGSESKGDDSAATTDPRILES